MCCGKGSFVRKLVVVGILLLVGTYVYRHTEVGSYVRAFFSQITNQAHEQIPNSVKLEALEQDIAQLEEDIKAKFSPKAELMTQIDRLDEEITATETALNTRKKAMSTVLTDLDSQTEFVTYHNQQMTRPKALEALQRDMEACKHLETKLSFQQDELAAKQRELQAKEEEVQNLVQQWQEFRVQLAELRAKEQQLRVQEDVNNSPTEQNPLIERIQRKIQQSQDHQKKREYKQNLDNRFFPNENVNSSNNQPEVNLEDIRNYVNPNHKISTTTSKE